MLDPVSGCVWNLKLKVLCSLALVLKKQPLKTHWSVILGAKRLCTSILHVHIYKFPLFLLQSVTEIHIFIFHVTSQQ